MQTNEVMKCDKSAISRPIFMFEELLTSKILH